MQQVTEWLEKLGLGQYAQRFADNDISFAVLPDLADQHLKEIGVSLGHRLQLLRAIAELPGRAKDTTNTAVAPAPSAAPQETAERRQVTVMFSDLVGSTALSARMDPEDLREVISAYQKCVAETVQRFGGFVAKYMGDGALVYFGYPQAHEDDAERAVRAGLDLIQAVDGLKSSTPLQTRVGIATGLVVVGDLIGSGSAQEQTVVGETPNVAARLQGIAAPNTIVIAESTRKLLGNLFDLQGLGGQDVKGIGVPVRAWAVLRPASVESRFEALHASGLTELVGREEELELLLRRWSKAKVGEGQVVLLSGEAGIGKSRLTAALMERLESEPHTRLRYFCSPQHTDSALYPIIGQMERAAGLAHGDTAQGKLDKLDALLAQTSTSKQDAALFAEMLSLPNDGRYPALDLDPQQRRQKTLEALIAQVEALSRHSPVLMIFEDAHWTDPTSLETFGRVVDRVRSLRVLLIVTFRPEFGPPWVGRPYVTFLAINRLGERDIGAMVDRVIGNKPLLAKIRQNIIERTDGIPLFVEEMTKAVLETGSEGAQQPAAAIPSPRLAVPATLQASLMARLDRLGPAKEVSQIGAAIGREFSHDLLSAVVSKPEPELSSALDRLMATGLLLRQGVPPYASYLFKHALVQDAAYSTLLREPRRAIHGRIADVLENQFPEIAESQPELMARHYTEAGAVEKAAGYWDKAGQRSLARSALDEAVEQTTRALAQIATLPRTRNLHHQEIKLQVALRNALMHLKGYAAPETKAAIERARVLIEEAEAGGIPVEDPQLFFSLLNGLWSANILAFEGDAAYELASQFLARAERQTDVALLAVGQRLFGASLLLTGEVAEGRTHLDRAIALHDATHNHQSTARLGEDVRPVILTFRSFALALLGYPNAALIDIDAALRDAREIGQFGTLIHALVWTSAVGVLCRHYAMVRMAADEIVVRAEEKSALSWRAIGKLEQGRLMALNGNASEAVHLLTSNIGAYRSTGSNFQLPSYMCHLAMAHAHLGQIAEARSAISEAIAMSERTKERWCDAEIYRVAGEIEVKCPGVDPLKAEEYFRRALSIARTQQARTFELRASMSMASLWRDQGRRNEARKLLTPIYGWFTEGFETLDLREANALLNTLQT
jgi:class 3 adenylate cyclase/predicted ATPase